MSISSQREDELDVSVEDAAEIGFKIVEMADRVLVAHKILPGSQAAFRFELDGQHFDVVVTVAKPTSAEGGA